MARAALQPLDVHLLRHSLILDVNLLDLVGCLSHAEAANCIFHAVAKAVITIVTVVAIIPEVVVQHAFVRGHDEISLDSGVTCFAAIATRASLEVDVRLGEELGKA